MRNALYNLFIHEVTTLCYRNCLEYFTHGSRILDVGIGNGSMIRAFHGLIRSKNLSITGIDINRCYLDHCSLLIRKWGLEENMTVLHEPVESYDPPWTPWFDFILFSMSFMLLDEPESVLDRIRPWLRPGGRVLFFQTMFRGRSYLMEIIKPRLKYVTSVDFGRVIYEEEFFRLLRDKDMVVDKDFLLSRKWFAGEYRLIVTSLPEHRDATSTFKRRTTPQVTSPSRLDPSQGDLEVLRFAV